MKTDDVLSVILNMMSENALKHNFKLKSDFFSNPFCCEPLYDSMHSSEGEKNLTKSRFRDEEQIAINVNAILIAMTDLESKR